MVVGIAWNAGVVRARLLVRRRLGEMASAELARQDSLADALRRLRDGPYGHDLAPDLSLGAAQWRAAATPLWHLRVLAGWLPPAGGQLVRTLAGWWEMLNIENRLAGLAGAPAHVPYDLGSLDTAWSRVREAGAPGGVRAELAASPWLDPGSDDLSSIVTWLRLSWAQRVARAVGAASRVTGGWAALVAARILLLGGADRVTIPPHDVYVLGRDWRVAEDVAGLSRRLPRDASWVLDDIADPDELWRAEVRWWRALDDEGGRLLRRSTSGPDVVFGVFCLLLADAHRVQGALEFAARDVIDEDVFRATL
jgi:hypothetical protein